MSRNPTEQCWVKAVITAHPQVAIVEALAQQQQLLEFSCAALSDRVGSNG
jgi:hypothetical protein